MQTLPGCSPAAMINRHIWCALPQQPSSGYKKGMHGGGTVVGSHVWALTMRNSCWALCGVTARNAKQG